MPDQVRRALLAGGVASLLGIGSSGREAAGLPATRTATEIAPGVFVMAGPHALVSATNEGHVANLSFVVGDVAIAVIDSGGSARNGAALLATIRSVSDRPIRYVVNTHMHPDHTFGNAAFVDPGTVFVGHTKLPRALAARAERYLATGRAELGAEAMEGTRVVMPTVLVESRTTLDLGNRTLTLTARKTAHTDNDLTVRDEATGTVFMGDLLFAEHIPTFDGSLRGWLHVLDDLAAEAAARVVPGHGPVSMPWPQAADAERAYFAAVAADVRAVIKSGGTLETAMATAGRGQRGAWQLFDEFHVRNVSAAFAELEWE